PMFDESLNPPPYVDLQAPEVIAPEVVAPKHAVSTGSPSSTTVDQACGRAFALGVAEAPQDPNVMMGTFSLNDHFATVLFNSGANYSFISTNFLTLIDMKTSVISPG
ncbi:hypothetical protein Tco_0513041, partial [Tanacetum coccineum]